VYLIFDTETTGLPRNWRAPLTDLDNWPRMVQLAWNLYGKAGTKIGEGDLIISPEGYTIPDEAARVHGITTARAQAEGVPLADALAAFQDMLRNAEYLVAHNISFDEKILGAEFLRKNLPNGLDGKKRICTMERSTDYCRIAGPRGFKWPNLTELHQTLFAEGFTDAHNAAGDVAATAKCFWELKRLGVIE
jgi:DNA polymerase III epsilon subunit-like protein